MIEVVRINEGRNAGKAGNMSHFLFLQRKKINLNITYKRCKNIGNTL